MELESKKQKVLIVDDHDETRNTYAELFRKRGVEVIEAKDGIEGLDVATSQDGIGAIFTGIIMPRMDGFQMIEALKRQTSTSVIPIFINSHLGREEDRKKAEELGTEGFIVRGVTPPIKAVEKIIKKMIGGEYVLKFDPLEFDAQRMANDLKMPEDFVCENCGTALAMRVSPSEDFLKGNIFCPGCKKEF